MTSSSSSSTGGGGGGGAPACDPAAPGVCCPDATCGKKCCYTPGQGLDCQSARCGDFRLACDDSRDCSGGELCCANRAASGDWDSDFRCKTAVMGQCPGTRVEICKVGSDAMCQSGGSCVPSAQLGGEHGSCVP